MTKISTIQKIAIVFLLTFSLKGFSQTQEIIEIVASHDATIDKWIKTTPNNGDVLTLEPRSSQLKRVLLKFDIPVFSNGVKIIKAEIFLTPTASNTGYDNFNTQIRALSADWEESSVTWKSINSKWASNKTSTTALKGIKAIQKWEVTKDVEKLQNGYEDNGWVIWKNNGGVTPWSFHSNSSSNVSARPKLVITYEVPLDPLIVKTVQQTNASFGENDGGAIVEISGFGKEGDVTLNWNPAISNVYGEPQEDGTLPMILSGLTARTYTLIVKRIADNSEVTHDLVISSNTPSAISELSSSKTNASYFGANDGTATLDVEGGTGQYDYAWTPDIGIEKGQGTKSASGLIAGTYTLLVVDKNQINYNFSKIFTITEAADNTPDLGGVTISKDQTSSSHQSSILDIQSSERGVLIPRMSSNERLDISNKVTPANGLLVYDNVLNKFFYWITAKTKWVEIGSGNTSGNLNITKTMTLQPSTTIPSSPNVGEMFLYDDGASIKNYSLKIWLGIGNSSNINNWKTVSFE